MKTTVKLICSAISALLIVTAFCVIASAEIVADIENGSFYASADVQETLYEAVMNSDLVKEKGFIPVKDSAIPLYAFEEPKEEGLRIKLAEYGEADEYLWKYVRDHALEFTYEKLPQELIEGHVIRYNTYYVKMLTPDGKPAGYATVRLRVDDNGSITGNSIAYNSEAYAKHTSNVKYSYSGPLNYADQAERIREIFSLDEIISPENVRLVLQSLPSQSSFMFFYVKTENIEAFVPVGFVLSGAPDDVVTVRSLFFMSGEDSIYLEKGYITVDEMKKWVRDSFDVYYKHLEINRDYYKEHGKVLIGGPGVSMSETVSGSVNAGKAYNVTDIKGYFEGKASAANLSASDAGTTGKTEENAANIWLPVGVAAAIIAVFAAGAVIFIKKKAK